MQATRAYVAGLGTAGSLLVGAALLFVLGSAVVGFGGWPKVASTPAVPAQVINAGASSGSPVARRLATLVRAPGAPAPRPAAARAARAGTGGAGTGRAGRAGGRRVGHHVTTATGPLASSANPRSGPTGTGGSQSDDAGTSSPSAGGGSPAPAPTGEGGVAGTVNKVTGTAGGTVSGTGSALGQTVTKVTGAAGGAVSGLGSKVSGGLGGS